MQSNQISVALSRSFTPAQNVVALLPVTLNTFSGAKTDAEREQKLSK
jgi:hypothetical protein